MMSTEQHLRNAVTTILLDHGVIRPLATLVLDYTLPVWTWEVDSDTTDVVSPQSNPQTIITKPTCMCTTWANLQSNRPLGVGDRLTFLFTIPDGDETNFIAIGCTNHQVSNLLNIYHSFAKDTIRVSHRKESQSTLYRPLGTYKGKVSTLSRIVLSRNDQEIRAQILFRDHDDELEFLVDTPEPHTIVFPKIDLFFDVYTVANPSNWTITLANFLN